jgi:hypothetical protein
MQANASPMQNLSHQIFRSAFLTIEYNVDRSRMSSGMVPASGVIHHLTNNSTSSRRTYQKVKHTTSVALALWGLLVAVQPVLADTAVVHTIDAVRVATCTRECRAGDGVIAGNRVIAGNLMMSDGVGIARVPGRDIVGVGVREGETARVGAFSGSNTTRIDVRPVSDTTRIDVRPVSDTTRVGARSAGGISGGGAGAEPGRSTSLLGRLAAGSRLLRAGSAHTTPSGQQRSMSGPLLVFGSVMAGIGALGRRLARPTA